MLIGTPCLMLIGTPCLNVDWDTVSEKVSIYQTNLLFHGSKMKAELLRGRKIAQVIPHYMNVFLILIEYEVLNPFRNSFFFCRK